MSLLAKGKTQFVRPSQFFMLYGEPGLGKTTTAIWLHLPENTCVWNFEKRAYHVPGVTRFEREDLPNLKSLYDFVDELVATKQFKCLVIDTLTALQPYIYTAVMTGDPTKYADDADYSKTHKKAVEEAMKFAKHLQKLKDVGIDVVITAHSKVSPFNDPQHEKPYDRYVVDSMYPEFARTFVKLADNVGFCRYKTEVVSEGKFKSKHDSSGERVIQFEWRPWATDCKNTLSLGYEVPMDLEANSLRGAIAAGSDNTGKNVEGLLSDIQAIISKKPESIKKAVTAALEKEGVKTSVPELIRIKSKLQTVVNT